MIKADIVKAVAKELDLNDHDALGIVDETIESVKQVICESGRLEIRDFGVFQVRQRKARIGRNPRNKKEYPIAPHRVVTYKMGKNLRIVDEGESPDGAADGNASTPESTPSLFAAPDTSS